nr:immunoglobulin light chain junction region [Macaca mulatta]
DYYCQVRDTCSDHNYIF